MLSICIPTYNYDVTNLVCSLWQQCKLANISFEILILEDGSASDLAMQNSNIEQFTNVLHIVNSENMGRSATRNILAEKAKFPKLLFIDCDSQIPNDNYIDNYLNNYDFPVVCGGTTYNKTQYSPEISLRYTFGMKVEKTTAEKRNQQPYSAFTTNNLCIDKKIFETTKFCEQLKKYGHEDSLFGLELKENKIAVLHIDNPVVHVGIEENKKFLEKTKNGIENLLIIKQIPTITPLFFQHIRLTRNYQKIEKLHLTWLVKVSYKITSRYLEKYLLSARKPRLLVFNFYKLGYLCSII